nr:glucose-6-phosphate dehydrogenase [Bacilli bacterium]
MASEVSDVLSVAPAHTFVLFGATGDLAKRKLYPAIFNLYRRQQIASPFLIVGVARRPHTDESFQEEIINSIHEFSHVTEEEETLLHDFARHFHYQSAHIDSDEEFQQLHNRIDELEKAEQVPDNRVFYLAMAPEFFGTAALHLQKSGLLNGTGFKRVIIEKPFGHDLASAQELNAQLRQVFEEEQIYRIDHYLGKEMEQNIEVLRFANSMFEPIWDNRSIANVQITSSETVGVEDRAGYYEQSGALRDMVQNHILQMVMMIAMEPPSRLNTEAIRDEKVKVLRSLRRYAVDDVANHVVRAQYTGQAMQDKTVLGYREEKGVAHDSTTETFIAAELFIDNFRWAGVPFYIRTGKRMDTKATEIVIQFKDMPKNMYFNQNGGLGPNLLVIRVNPAEGMYLQINTKRPGSDNAVIPVALEFSQESNAVKEAYERLIFDAVRGDSTYFTRWDEVSLAWKFVDPIAKAFRENPQSKLHTYLAGSSGPQASNELLVERNFKWWPVFGQEVPATSLEQYFARKGEAKRP